MVKNILLFTTGFLLATLIWAVLVFGLRAFDKDKNLSDENESPELEEIVGKKWYYSSNNISSEWSTIYIELSTDGTFSGFSGCNTFGGTYTHGNKKINFSEISSTEMYCEDFMNHEEAFLASLEEVTSYDARFGWLYLSARSDEYAGENSMSFFTNTIHSSNLAGGWKLEKIVTEGNEVESLNKDANIQLTGEGKLSGKVCNNLTGTFSISVDKEENLKISNIASTKMFCAEPEGLMEQESTVTEILSGANKFEISNGTLKIYSDENTYLEFGYLVKQIEFMRSL